MTMRHIIDRLLCLVDRHEWGEPIEDRRSNGDLSFVYWTCRRCGGYGLSIPPKYLKPRFIERSGWLHVSAELHDRARRQDADDA